MKPLLFGKYCLLERISVGGMAEVFRAKPFNAPDFNGYLALKKILPHLAEDDEFIQMFVDEAKLTVQLTHPNIVRIFELGKFQTSYYILMEFISGKDLLSLQKRVRKRREVIGVTESCHIAHQVARGLDFAHHKVDENGNPLNIIHRDISPQNVLIDWGGRVKIIDFGIAKAAVQRTKTKVGVLKGKMGYMSPEQVSGFELDHRSDVFSIGTILWEMLTNRRLFSGDNEFETMQKVRGGDADPPSTRNPNIPEEVDRIVMKALATDREDRYQTAGLLADDLEAFLSRQGFQQERLALWMSDVFADDLEEERAKRREFAKIQTPDDVRELLLEGAEAGEGSAVAGEAISEEPQSPVAGAADAPATEEAAEKTELWDAEILPQEGEDPSEFAAQHTVVQAGGFDASMMEREGLDEPSSIELQLDDIEFQGGGAQPADTDEQDTLERDTLDREPPVAQQSHQQMAAVADFAAEGTATGPTSRGSRGGAIGVIILAVSLMVFVLATSVFVYFYLEESRSTATETAQSGTMVISVSPPSGLEILLDGKMVGEESPLTLEEVEAGPHVLEIRHPEFQEFRERVTVESGGLRPVNVDLVPATPPEAKLSLTFSDPPDSFEETPAFTLYLDGRKVTRAEAETGWTLPAGAHLVEAVGPELQPWTSIVRLDRDEKQTVEVEFEPRVYQLRIESKPAGANVRLDDEDLGDAPVELTLQPGRLAELELTGDSGSWESVLGYPMLGEDAIAVDLSAPPEAHTEADFGWLTVTTGDHWWEVLIDSKPTGQATPVLADAKIPVLKGERTITLKRGMTEHDIEVSVHPGETVVIRREIAFNWEDDHGG